MCIKQDKRHILDQLECFPSGDTILARRARTHALGGQAAEPAPQIPEMPPEYADRLGKMRYATKEQLLERVNNSREAWRNFHKRQFWAPWRAVTVEQDIVESELEAAIAALVNEQQIIVHNGVVALIAEQKRRHVGKLKEADNIELRGLCCLPTLDTGEVSRDFVALMGSSALSRATLFTSPSYKAAQSACAARV